MFSGDLEDYRVTTNIDGTEITVTDTTSADGTDSLNSVETLAFSDGQELSISSDNDGEAQVNTYNASSQYQSSVTGLADGNYVITWSDNSGTQSGGSSYDIRAQLYNETGSAIGDEFRVNTWTGSAQYDPSVTMLSDGGFVISWRDDSGHDDGSSYDVRAQRYDAGGSALGEELLVNSYVSGNQYEPSITALADGGFAGTWRDDNGSAGSRGGSSYDIFAKTFTTTDADDNAVDTPQVQVDEFLVNPYTSGSQ